MKIKRLYIENFRGIKKLDLNFDKDISLFVGNNGTSKTAILEAINYCCSDSFSSSKVKYSDFYNNTNNDIIIIVEFNENYSINIVDGFKKREIKCNSVELCIKKRIRKAPNKYLSDSFSIEHFVVPKIESNIGMEKRDDGYILPRLTSKTPLEISNFSLSFNTNSDIVNFPKIFYFGKDRKNQIKNNGFSSSLSSLFDDFNWNFYKKNNTTEEYKNQYLENINNLENFILNNIDKKILPNIKKDLIDNFQLNDFNLSFFDRNEPFNQAWFSKTISENFPLPINTLGSGIEMIVSIIFLMNLARQSKENNIILLLDEPEINLHPNFQINLIEYLKSIKKQIFFSTHSPYFVKECFNEKCDVYYSKKEVDNITYNRVNKNSSIFPWGPTYAEINYYAYNLYSDEFHDELYGYLMQLLFENGKIEELMGKSLNNYIDSRYQEISKKEWIKINKQNKKQPPENVPLFDYIRNHFHHPENTYNTKYTNEELKKSIEDLIAIIDKEK